MKRLLLCALLLTLPALAQQPTAAPLSAAPAPASVQFSFDWPQGIPWQKYTIEVQVDGKSRFDGTPHDETSDADPVQQDFTMSEANRVKVFELAQKLGYFRGDFRFAPQTCCANGRENSPVPLAADHRLHYLQLVAK